MDNQPIDNEPGSARDLLMLVGVSLVSVAGSYGALRLVYWLLGWGDA